MGGRLQEILEGEGPDGIGEVAFLHRRVDEEEEVEVCKATPIVITSIKNLCTLRKASHGCLQMAL